MYGSIKKYQIIPFIIFFSLIISMTAYAKINITANDISGDENLKSTALSLPAKDNVIDQNAVYVATDGSDGNPGTIDKPYASVYYAIRKISSSDTTIYIRGGVYDQKIAVTKSGTADKYLTIKAYPGEKPIFETSSTGRIIDPNNNNYIYIDGLTLKTKQEKIANSTHGIEMVQGHHLIFRNLEIYNINVPDSTSSSVASHAFNLYGNNASVPISNVLIENCYVHDLDPGWSEAITVNGNSEYVNVINCRIKDIGNIGLDFAGNFGACSTTTLDQARYCVARGNEVSGCISPNARSYGLYNDGGSNNIFDRNIVYGCSGGIEIGSEEGGRSGKLPVQNLTITNNLIYNNNEIGIAVGGYSITNKNVGYVNNVKIYNNTIVNNGETDITVNKSDGLDYRNNIIYAEIPKNSNSSYKNVIKLNFGSSYITNLNFSNNIYYSPNGVNAFCFRIEDAKNFGIENWIDKTGKFTDPLFTDNYTLSALSPAISFADNSIISDVGTYDLYGNLRVNEKLDAGCYEYNGDVVVTTNPTFSTTATESTTESTTEATTEITTKEITETTTSDVNNSSTWDFTDNSWSDKATGKKLYNVNGLTVYHAGAKSGVPGFKFEKNTKSPATGGYYIQLDAKANDKITIYVNSDKSAGLNAVLALAELSDNATVVKDTQSVLAKKSGDYIITFNIPKDGTYVIYTDNSSAGSIYYAKVILESPVKKGDLNQDGLIDEIDAVLAMKDYINVQKLENSLIPIGDIDDNGIIDIIDVIAILNMKTK